MFGNLLENLQQKKAEMAASLGQITATATVNGITVEANGAKQVLNIDITDAELLADKEQLEDLLLVAINRALNEASEKSQAEMQAKMAEMLPPGLGNIPGLGDLFK